MTEARAGNIVRYNLRPVWKRPFELRYKGRSYHRTYEALGVSADVPAMLKLAWTQPRVPLLLTFDEAQTKASIRRAARAVNQRPVAPRFIGDPRNRNVREGKPGRRVNIWASAERVKTAILANQRARSAELVVQHAPPPFTASELMNVNVRVGQFATRFNPREAARTDNLRLVTSRLDGAFVKPGESFSFNNWVGERRESDGFRNAIVFKDGKMVEDLAGGLCQVSSTLYNVALEMGLPITQRRNHSLKVKYVPAGRDATVYWGRQDLAFRNDTDSPLYFRAYTSRSSLIIETWADSPLKRTVRVSSTSRYKGDTLIAQVYRTITENGRKRSELVSTDTYKPTPTEPVVRRRT
ncbi:MAG: hypothetical protein GYA63_11445 [Armatimonadetes bacterium]|nr:hypothetical protein [Armatimonadota bacterium]